MFPPRRTHFGGRCGSVVRKTLWWWWWWWHCGWTSFWWRKFPVEVSTDFVLSFLSVITLRYHVPSLSVSWQTWTSFFCHQYKSEVCSVILRSERTQMTEVRFQLEHTNINPLNSELNPICYLLALLGAHHFLHVSRIRVKLLTFRLLMSYIWSTHSWCF